MLLCETCGFFVNGYLQLKLYETSTRRYVQKGATDVGIMALFFSVTACVLPKTNGAVPPAMSYISFRMRFEKKRTIHIFLVVSYSYNILLRFTSNPLSLTQSNLALQQTSCVFHVSGECQFVIKHRNVNDDDGWSYIKISKTVTITLNKYHTEHVHENANIS